MKEYVRNHVATKLDRVIELAEQVTNVRAENEKIIRCFICNKPVLKAPTVGRIQTIKQSKNRKASRTTSRRMLLNAIFFYSPVWPVDGGSNNIE